MKIIKEQQNKINEDINADEILSGLSLKPLELAIKKKIGFQPDLKILRTKNNRYVEVGDLKNLASKAGILSDSFKELFIKDFGTEIFIKKDTGKTMWSGSMDFKYEFISGGSNGHKILSFWYDFSDSSWQFRDANGSIF